jgi:hypothetical protein
MSRPAASHPAAPSDKGQPAPTYKPCQEKWTGNSVLKVTKFVFGAPGTSGWLPAEACFGRRYRALMLKAIGDMCRATRLAIMGTVISRNFLKCAVARCASKAVASEFLVFGRHDVEFDRIDVGHWRKALTSSM